MSRLFISIHTLRMEGDKDNFIPWKLFSNFNPHPPYGGWRITYVLASADVRFQSTPSVWRVTLHSFGFWKNQLHFNPHPPYGGWQTAKTKTLQSILFQSTPSVWRVTLSSDVPGTLPTQFQSTPSVWRVTNQWIRLPIDLLNFNPHPPYGGWRKVYVKCL